MENQVRDIEDLVYQILLKVPAKSLAKCKCVCKKWCSIIGSKGFIDDYLSPTNRRPCFLFRFSRSINSCKQIHWISFSQRDPSCSDQYHKSTILFPYPNFQFISQSIRGFICLRYLTKVFICNTMTSQLVSLPNLRAYEPNMATLFGYDEIDDNFKVLCFTVLEQGRKPLLREQHVCTFGDQEWRQINCILPHKPITEGICKNSTIYYGALALSPMSIVAMAFHLNSEEFRVINVPKEIESCDDSNKIMSFSYNGKMGLIHQHSTFDFWVLEDVETVSWTKLYVLPAESMYESCIGSIGDDLIFEPDALTLEFYVRCHHMKTNTVRIIPFPQIPQQFLMTLNLDHDQNYMIL